ncbi:histidine kinase [Mucilaginibacter sp.]|uniref:sensor histidine kinase n=1 Tax=Mucilaginibacter sp. TaxID=1882438 RepID=UPI002608613D|nr:histidine kinase [Mucilaginibacter sp.]MDB5032698.1 hypothetical protein [Mucilaginibacter sp.]
MKVRWRKHEIIIVSMLVGLTAIGDILYNKKFTGQFLIDQGIKAFNDNHIRFSYSNNVLLPQAGVLLVFYLIYLWLNLITVPTFLKSNKTKIIAYFLAALQLVTLSYLLALGVNAATYYAHPYYFNYGGFGSFAMFGYNDEPLKHLFFGFDRALILVGIYLTYISIREYIIYKIDKSGTKKPFRILITNQITTLLVIFFTVPALALTFHLINNDFIYLIYFVFVSPTIIVYITLTYWLFPAKEVVSFNFQFVGRLIVITFIFTFIGPVFWVLFTHVGFNGNLLPLCWGFQLLVVTPVTWLLYQQRKDKILQLSGAAKALTKSKADLQFLRSQINPHFLFNVLNTLYGTALREKAKDTAEGIQKLGDMMRFMLGDNHLDFIPMSSEIAYLNNYISLQKLRIQIVENITIETNINEDNCRHLIAPMLLIPFVENAFKHGINPLEKSWIKINLNCDQQQIHFEVRNSVFPTTDNDPEKDYSGIGLQNVRERLNLFYIDQYQLNYGINNAEFVAELIIDTMLITN